MKHYFSIPLLSILWLLAKPAQSAPPSAETISCLVRVNYESFY